MTDQKEEIKQQIEELSYNINPNHFENKEGKAIDYTRLVKQFGTQIIDKKLLERFENITQVSLHPFLKREIFFSHRDLNVILDHIEKGKKIFLYTGRGPSTLSMHLGHLLPFIFCKYLQDAFKCNIVIQMTDDEKFFYQDQDDAKPLSWFQEAAIENAKDIIACGFDLEKTFIFRDLDYIQYLYPNIVKLQSMITYNQIKGIFGFNGSENVGKVGFGAIQASPCIPSSFKEIFNSDEDILCLIPCGIDQDPYFRMTRDIAPRLKFPKPCTMYSKFFPALQGHDKKMSSSDPTSTIFLTDTDKQIANKIKKHAFSGGQADLETHRKLGADIEVDVSIAYLEFFLENDNQLEEIKQQYKTGQMLTSEVKNILIDVLQKLVLKHQTEREKVT